MSELLAAWTKGPVRCADAVHTRMFDDELVILDLAKGEYFALDEVGARLWSGLSSGKTVEQIASDVVATHDVTLEEALADLIRLADELLSRGLMLRDEATLSSDLDDDR